MASGTEIATAQAAAKEERVGVGETLAYGSGGFAEMMVFNPATTFLMFFYTDIAGIAAATVGNLMLLSRVFDFLNPAMGWLVDRTKSRHGKARPWLLWMAIPFGVCGAILFIAPPLSPVLKIVYAFITYNLALTLIYPLIDVPYGAMLPLLTSEANQRTRLSLARQILGQFGGMVSYAITIPMVHFFGGGASGWSRSFMVFGAVAAILLLICFAATKERVKPVSTQSAHPPIQNAFGAVLKNKYWWLLAGLYSMTFLSLGFFSDNLYYCRYFLHDVSRFGPLMALYQMTLVVGMIFAGPLIKRFGKRNTAMTGAVIALLGQASILISPTSYAMVLAGTVIRAIGISPMVGTTFAMVADAIDYGEWKFNLRAQGTAFGTMALVMKLAIGLGNVLVGWILGLTGYIGASIVQRGSALFAIKAMFLYAPMVFLAVSCIILWIYKLDKQYPLIIAELKIRRTMAT